MRRVVGTLGLVASVTHLVLAQSPFPDCEAGPLSKNAVCDTALDPVSRAAALVAAMTLEEKINNTQYEAPGVPRLGLPAYNWWSEALHGVAGSPGVHFSDSGNFSYATSFPSPIVLGATFDDDLVKRIATVVGTEGRAYGNAGHAGLDYWTPNINPYRDPRWGRGQETPGEDPFHTSQYVYHLIDGLQGGIGPENPRIVATCKHFAGYDLEDWEGNERYAFNAVISDQDLAEYYLPPFKTCTRDAKVDAVMCSYNAVNGIPTCADPWLLQTLLRDHWQWEDVGHWVTSDCGAIDNIYKDHRYVSDGAHAAAVALNAGTDLDCGTVFPQFLGSATMQGLLGNGTLDRALTRLYSSLVKLGYFDPADDQPYRSIGWDDVSTPYAERLAHTAAVEGIVLLKNDGTLPLKRNGTVAIVGPYANATKQMQGNYEGTAPYIRTMLWGASQHGYNARFAPGTGIDSNSSSGFGQALDVARSSDIIIYAGGIDNDVEAEAHDRESIAWPGNQLDLIEQLSELKKPLVVVQFGGGQVDDSSILSNSGVNGLLWAGYPSQAGGAAVFDILTGKTAPAGRLPVTQYPADYVDLVPMTDMNLRPGPKTPGRTYRWYDKAVLPFGYGNHYTTFDVSWKSKKYGPYNTASMMRQLSGASIAENTTFETFSLRIHNTGKVTSDYVALVFLTTTDAGPKPYPIKTLVGYQRVKAIRPGEIKFADIRVTVGAVARTSNNGDMVLYPGQYQLQVDVGKSYPTANFAITGKEVVLDHFPRPGQNGTEHK
ncbi:putative exo-1,4-beta-xylosidase bxlB [Aspergillus ambiguus]|uniref:putative beta-xylosidase n=1 Tax=Aspergillus ambiguus TaxID=176160 RepID=UPI003CCCF309